MSPVTAKEREGKGGSVRMQTQDITECRLRLRDEEITEWRLGNGEIMEWRLRNGKIAWNVEWSTTACSTSPRHVIG